MADLSQLTDEQIKALQKAHADGLGDDQISALGNLFLDQNSKAPAMKQGPGPGPAKVDTSFVQPVNKYDSVLFNGKEPDENTLRAMYNQRVYNAPLQMLNAGTAAATGGVWPAVLSSLTSRTPTDAVTGTALNAAIPGLGLLRAPGKTLNGILGALKGWGLYEGGNQLHAGVSQVVPGVNGQVQPEQAPSANPLNKTNAWDMAFSLLSPTLGALHGTATAPSDGKPDQLDIFKSAMARWKAYKDRLAELTTQHGVAQNEIKPATNAWQDAQARLRQFEANQRYTARQAATQERTNFNNQQKQLAADTKDLGFQVQNQKTNLENATQAYQDHIDSMAGAAQGSNQQTAEGIQNQVLDLQRKLDGLRNPDTAHQFLPSSDEEVALRTKIADLNTRLNSGKYNAGGVSQIQDALTNSQQSLEDLNENRVRTEIDNTKDQIRRLQVAQRRFNQGRVDQQPLTEEDRLNLNRASELQATQQAEEQKLADLTRRYQASVMARLSHAKNAPGGTIADINNVETHQRLMDDVVKALDAKRAAEQKPGAIATLIDQHKENAQKAGIINEPTAPKQSSVFDALKKYGPHVVAGGAGILGGHDVTGLPVVANALLGGGVSLATKALFDTPAGQKLLQFFASRVSPNATSAIPAMVNQNTHPNAVPLSPSK